MTYYVINADGEGYQLNPDESGVVGDLPSGSKLYEMSEEGGLVPVDPRILKDGAIKYGEPGSLEYLLAKDGGMQDNGFSSPNAVSEFLKKSGAPADFDWSGAIKKAWQQQQSQNGSWSGADDPGQTALKILAQVDAPWKNTATNAVASTPEFAQSQKAGAAAVNYSGNDGFLGTGIPTPIASFAIGMLLGPAGMNIGASLAGGTGLTASAINAGISSFLTGGDPLKGALTSLVGGGIMENLDAKDLSSVLEAQDAAAGAEMLASSGQSYDQFIASLSDGAGTATDALVAGMGGVSTDAGKTLLAGGSYGGTTDVVPVVDGPITEQIGGTSSDPMTALGESGGLGADAAPATQLNDGVKFDAIGSSQSAEDAAMGQSMLGNQTYDNFLSNGGQFGQVATPLPNDPTPTAPNPSVDFNDGFNDQTVAPALNGDPSGDITNPLWKSLTENKQLATAGVMAGGGLIAGAMNNQAANERLDKTAAYNSSLQSQKVTDQANLDATKRAAIQGGSYFDAKVNMRPGSRVLRRPDGSFVYATPGLIAGQRKG